MWLWLLLDVAVVAVCCCGYGGCGVFILVVISCPGGVGLPTGCVHMLGDFATTESTQKTYTSTKQTTVLYNILSSYIVCILSPSLAMKTICAIPIYWFSNQPIWVHICLLYLEAMHRTYFDSMFTSFPRNKLLVPKC